MNLARCPYCSKSISYFTAMTQKDEGEYVCTSCNKNSKIIIKKQILIIFALAFVIALVILLCLLKLTELTNLYGLIFVGLPFVIFYLCAPFFVDLVGLKKYKKSGENKQRGGRNMNFNQIAKFDEDVFRIVKESKRQSTTEFNYLPKNR